MLMHQRGLSKQWVEEGRRWLFVFQDTNPLHFRILCALLGVSSKNGYVMNSVAIPRIPGESIGGICKLTSPSGAVMTLNVEYNQLEPLLRESGTGDVADDTGFSPYPGNINVLLFSLPRYSECLDSTGGVVPEFINPKWADSGRTAFKSSTRLECMMQDFPRLCGPEDKVGVTQFERWIAKTSVKNNLVDARKKNPPECALTAEADLYACNARLLQYLVRAVWKGFGIDRLYPKVGSSQSESLKKCPVSKHSGLQHLFFIVQFMLTVICQGRTLLFSLTIFRHHHWSWALGQVG